MNPHRVAIFGLLVLLAGFGSFAQLPPEGHRIVTKTRLQVVFSELENQWLAAVQKRDEAALNKLLADSFEEWIPAQPDPIPLEDWRQRAFGEALQSFQIRQLAVRAVKDDVSVASFVLQQKIESGGKVRTENDFVIDVWVKDGGSWRCTDRYTSPGPSTTAPAGDIRPTGKQ